MRISELPEFDIEALHQSDYGADRIDWEQYPNGLAQSDRGLEVLGYDVMSRIYRSKDFVDPMPIRFQTFGLDPEGPAHKALLGIMSGSEGDDHLRMRRAFQPWFLADNIERYRVQVRKWVDDWMSQAALRDEADFANELGRRLPSLVFTQILGIGEKDADFFAHLSSSILKFAVFDPSVRDIVEGSVLEALEWIDEFLTFKTKNPEEGDLTTSLLAAEQQGTIEREHTLRILLTLILGSTETTTSQMAVNLLTLADHKDQWRLLKTGKANVATAVPELYRYEPGGRSTVRISYSPADLDGVEVDAMQPIFMNRFAASNDPSAYEEPRVLDVTAGNRRAPFTFGFGRHACVGRTIAVLEQEEVIASALEHWDDFEITAAAWRGLPYQKYPEEFRIAAAA